MIDRVIKQIEELFNSNLTDWHWALFKITAVVSMSFKVAKKLIRYAEELKTDKWWLLLMD